MTLEFDSESMTEDEVERSLRDVLPSQHQRRKLRREGASLTGLHQPTAGGQFTISASEDKVY